MRTNTKILIPMILSALSLRINQRIMRLSLVAAAVPILLGGALIQTVSAQTPITKIEVRLETCNFSGSGTDASVYLGIGGREFNLDLPSVDDRETGHIDIYVLGSGTNVSNSGENNPSSAVQLTTADVDNFPIYIRMSDKSTDFPDDNWCVRLVRVTVTPGSPYSRLGSGGYVWLHPGAGLTLYLKP